MLGLHRVNYARCRRGDAAKKAWSKPLKSVRIEPTPSVKCALQNGVNTDTCSFCCCQICPDMKPAQHNSPCRLVAAIQTWIIVVFIYSLLAVCSMRVLGCTVKHGLSRQCTDGIWSWKTALCSTFKSTNEVVMSCYVWITWKAALRSWRNKQAGGLFELSRRSFLAFPVTIENNFDYWTIPVRFNIRFLRFI